MNKRILTLCLALALFLSLIPAAASADTPMFSYKEIPTDVEATGISMMDNGVGSYYYSWEQITQVLVKGIVDPSGEVTPLRKPNSSELYISTDSLELNYSGAGNAIVDMRFVSRWGNEGDEELSEDFEKDLNGYPDWKIFDKKGNFRSYVREILAEYEAIPITDIGINSLSKYFGKDGYLTVYVTDQTATEYTYIIDLETLQVVFKQPRVQSGSIEGVSEGLIAYREYSYGASSKRSGGWKDITGKEVISIDTDSYNDLENFSCGRAVVWGIKSKAFGYVDKAAREVIPCVYQEAGMFQDGYAYVQDQDGKYGYINTAGKTVIPFEYNRGIGYGEGLFAVGVRDENNVYSYGLVDINNNVVVPLEYDSITYVRGGTAYAIKDGKIVVLKLTHEGPVESYPMPKSNGKSSNFEVIPALNSVTVTGSQSESEPVLIASYDEEGRFLGVEVVTENEAAVRFSSEAERLLFLATDGSLQPMAEAIEVDLAE